MTRSGKVEGEAGEDHRISYLFSGRLTASYPPKGRSAGLQYVARSCFSMSAALRLRSSTKAPGRNPSASGLDGNLLCRRYCAKAQKGKRGEWSEPQN